MKVVTALALLSSLIIAPVSAEIHSKNYNSPYLAVNVEKIYTGEFFTITGNFRKNSPNGCNYAQVTFNLYDKQNRLIGQAIDNINNLPAFTDWRFSAITAYDARTFHRYQIVEKICD